MALKKGNTRFESSSFDHSQNFKFFDHYVSQPFRECQRTTTTTTTRTTTTRTTTMRTTTTKLVNPLLPLLSDLSLPSAHGRLAAHYCKVCPFVTPFLTTCAGARAARRPPPTRTSVIPLCADTTCAQAPRGGGVCVHVCVCVRVC